MLAEEREAVFGSAVVVRHAAGGQGKLEGIGLRYVAVALRQRGPPARLSRAHAGHSLSGKRSAERQDGTRGAGPQAW